MNIINAFILRHIVGLITFLSTDHGIGLIPDPLASARHARVCDARLVKVVDVYHRRSPLVQEGLEPVGVCRDGTNTGLRMKLWFKRNTQF